MLPILLMQMLIQNKLFLAVVPCSDCLPVLHLVSYISTILFLGLALPAATPHHHRIQSLNSDTVMYSCTLGRIQTTTTKQSRTQVSWDSSRIVASPSVLVLTHPNSCPCHLPDQPQEAKSSQGPSPGPQLLVLGLWDPRTFPKIAKLQPWFVDFIPFHSKGFRNKVQLTGPKKSLKIKQLTHQRVKLMQFF